MRSSSCPLVFLCLLAGLCAPLGAQRAIGFFAGDSAGDRLGGAVAVAGDVDADGFDDLIIGARFDDNNGASSGSARVVSGKDGTTLYTFDGDSAVDEFGAAVSGAGDVNGDGFADVIVGAPRDDNNGFDSGSARVLSGKDGTTLYTFDGAAGDLLGETVSGAGDVNRDGYADVIVGARFADVGGISSGSALVFSGKDGTELYRFDGDSAGDLFGSAVAGAGDVDGDGFDDLVVGAPADDNNGTSSGMVRVFSGFDGSVLHSFDGDSAGDLLGQSVGGAGDVDNDGFADVIAGAPGDDNNGSASGSARVFSGQAGGVLYTFDGSAAGADLGRSVAGAGDVDADGFDDLIVGAPKAAGGRGLARVYSGRSGAELFVFLGNGGSELGTAVAGGGDFDCDGYADLLVGAPKDAAGAGTARGLSGVDGRLLRATGDAADRLGAGVALLGDVDSDGVPDVLAGAPGDDNNGADSGNARVLSGVDGSVVHSLDGDSAGDGFGAAVANAGRIDGDNVDDFIVGAPGDDDNGMGSGSARVFSGASGAVLYTFRGDSAGDAFGTSVAGAGDVNNDGFDDVIVGAPGDDNNGADSGSARVLSGKDGTTLYTFVGDAAGDRLGTSVAGAGDIDKDGFDDVVAGAPGDDNSGADSGSARVFGGIDGVALYTFDGDGAGDAFGSAVAGAGDVDNDTFVDVVVGAPGDDDNGAGAGRARVHSGQTGAAILDLDGAAAGDAFGTAVAGAGDVDGDGFADVLVGAPGVDANGDAAGAARVCSGQTGATLLRFDGRDAGDGFGGAVAGGQDVDGDGWPDVAVGGAAADTGTIDGGEVRVSATRDRIAGKVTYFAAACPTSGGLLPRIEAETRPVISQLFVLSMAAGPPNASTALHLDNLAQDIDLGFLGFTGCTLQCLPFFGFNTTSNGAGAATISLPLPSRLSMVGNFMFAQYLALDAGNNTVVVSNAAKLTFGVQ